MKNGWRHYALANLFLVGLATLTFRTAPGGNLGIDFLALGLTSGVILAILGGVIGGVGLIRRADGEMDSAKA